MTIMRQKWSNSREDGGAGVEDYSSVGKSAIIFRPGLEDGADQQEPHSTYLAEGGREGQGMKGLHLQLGKMERGVSTLIVLVST